MPEEQLGVSEGELQQEDLEGELQREDLEGERGQADSKAEEEQGLQVVEAVVEEELEEGEEIRSKRRPELRKRIMLRNHIPKSKRRTSTILSADSRKLITPRRAQNQWLL